MTPHDQETVVTLVEETVKALQKMADTLNTNHQNFGLMFGDLDARLERIERALKIGED